MVLAKKAASFLVLQQKEAGPPFDFANERGSVTDDDPPTFASCEDFFTDSWGREPKQVLAPFSNADLCALRMLGMPCTPAAGMQRMSFEQAHRLLDEPHIAHQKSYGPPAAVTLRHWRVTLVAWQVAVLINQKPVGFQAAVSHLQKAIDTFGLGEISRVDVWNPTADEVNRIRSAVALKDRGRIVELMWQSIARSTYSIWQFLQNEKALRNSRDYLAARRELQQVALWYWSAGRRLHSPVPSHCS